MAMAPERRDPSTEATAHRFGTLGRCFNHPKDSADSLQMGDEGCPNENTSVDDAAGYSREEEEAESRMGEEAS